MVSDLIQLLITLAVLGYCVWQSHESKTERQQLVRENALQIERLTDRIQHPEVVRVQEPSTVEVPEDATTQEILHLVRGE